MTWVRVQRSRLWLGILLWVITASTACSFFADDELVEPIVQDLTVDCVDDVADGNEDLDDEGSSGDAIEDIPSDQDACSACGERECGAFGACDSCGTCTGCESECVGYRCEPASEADTACRGGDIWWVDSCGNWEGDEPRDECATPCSGGDRFCPGDPCAACGERECGTFGDCASCGNCTGCESVCDGNACAAVQRDHQDCSGGHPYWYDSCGGLGSRVETCEAYEPCVDSGDTAFCIDFVEIPPGTFCMGSPDGSTACLGETPPSELGRGDDEALHEVTLTTRFFLQETEVTQRQWSAMDLVNPSSFAECGLDCPVENVNWWEAVAYVNVLSEAEGLTPCYTLEGCNENAVGEGMECTGVTVLGTGNPYDCEGYRLPTDAEWEYAYRARTRTAFYNGGITNTARTPLDETLDLIGWYGGNSGVGYSPGSDCSDWGVSDQTTCGTHEVGGKTANDWGLYDMSGNVWEWVWDWYDTYPSGPVEDPLGGVGSFRVRRGGSFRNHAQFCRAANRNGGADPDIRGGHLGFRAARSSFPSHCYDDETNDGESDVDCGGDCRPCVLGRECGVDSDCASEHCSNDHCAPEGFAYIPDGTFCMGSPDGSKACIGETPADELGRDGDETLHEVTLTTGFFLQETEVTQRQWTALGFTNPSSFDECDLDCPVEKVNWWEAVAYVNALSEAEDLTPCYELTGCNANPVGQDMECTGITVLGAGNPYDCDGYRLPTEAEWEYACRAGARTAFYNGGITETECGSDPNLTEIGWYCGNAGSTTHIVSPLNGGDGKAANGWSLCDMSGNVSEWVWDWYDTYPTGPVVDPLGGAGSYRVLRGGSWSGIAQNCRAANRGKGEPVHNNYAIGFRPARSVLLIP